MSTVAMRLHLDFTEVIPRSSSLVEVCLVVADNSMAFEDFLGYVIAAIAGSITDSWGYAKEFAAVVDLNAFITERLIAARASTVATETAFIVGMMPYGRQKPVH